MNAPDTLLPPTDAIDIPEGFRVVSVGGHFVAHNGPLYARLIDGRVQVEARRDKCAPRSEILMGG